MTDEADMARFLGLKLRQALGILVLAGTFISAIGGLKLFDDGQPWRAYLPEGAAPQQQRGYVEVLGTTRRLTQEMLTEDAPRGRDAAERLSMSYDDRLRWRYDRHRYDRFVRIDHDGIGIVSASAPGVDRKHHYANSYLVGYAPYEASSPLAAVRAFAHRKTYERDDEQYDRREVWQNSHEAYQMTRGDCEDHALIVADWLIEMGYDARVAVGTYRWGGHAWVVLFSEGQEYVIDTTDTGRASRLRAFPLASADPNYSPQYQFDREYFWVNKGGYTQKYKGPHWERRSRFVPSAEDASGRDANDERVKKSGIRG